MYSTYDRELCNTFTVHMIVDPVNSLMHAYVRNSYSTSVGANNIDEHYNVGHAGEELKHCVQRIDC